MGVEDERGGDHGDAQPLKCLLYRHEDEGKASAAERL